MKRCKLCKIYHQEDREQAVTHCMNCSELYKNYTRFTSKFVPINNENKNYILKKME
jgi:hypothetical protein